ncbi:MAG: hypothetical protein ACD_62C00572G0001 [uncultured bacterium]|nr:MAG: hypothetical protein ACD_62C00572G0001 [uncultured bacterium]HLD45508.1 elongation factor P [bacterium]
MQGNDLRKGNVIKLENKLWLAMSVEHRTPGNLRAFIQAKMRSIGDGTQKEFRFSSTERLEQVDIFERKMQYLYSDGDVYNFMDTENFEQIELSKETIGDYAIYLTPEMNISVAFCENNPITVKLPTTMDFEVVEADPEIKGATASASYKSATLSNGLNVQVPQFVKVKDVIRINVEKGEYQERVKR